MRTIESLIQKHGIPSYVKLDVEGYELQVVLGLESKVRLLSLEYHLNDEDCATKLKVIRRLKGLGTLSFNLLREGDGKFLWTQFVSERAFLENFPNLLKSQGGEPYGDIFTRID